MRSVRFCKTILNRLGTYDKEIDAWKGKFPCNEKHRMYLEKHYSVFSPTGEKARVSILTPDNVHRYLDCPAQAFRRILWGITRTTLELVPNQKPLLYSGLTMYGGFPDITLHMVIGNNSYIMSIHSRVSIELFRDAWYNISLWPIFLDSLVDHERGGEQFVNIFNKYQYGSSKRTLEP